MKACIVPRSHCNTAKHAQRIDSPRLSKGTFRLITSTTAEQRWRNARLDIAAIFQQAGGYNREVFVKPSKGKQDRTVLWRWTAAAFGFADSGRL